MQLDNTCFLNIDEGKEWVRQRLLFYLFYNSNTVPKLQEVETSQNQSLIKSRLYVFENVLANQELLITPLSLFC